MFLQTFKLTLITITTTHSESKKSIIFDFMALNAEYLTGYFFLFLGSLENSGVLWRESRTSLGNIIKRQNLEETERE